MVGKVHVIPASMVQLRSMGTVPFPLFFKERADISFFTKKTFTAGCWFLKKPNLLKSPPVVKFQHNFFSIVLMVNFFHAMAQALLKRPAWFPSGIWM